MKISSDSTAITLISQQKMNECKWTEGIYYLEDLTWNQEWVRFWQTKFKILITNNNEVIYQSNEGVIIRKDKIIGEISTLNILTKLPQVKYLKWNGQYGKQNLKKVGKWTVTWEGQVLSDVGGWYSEDGKKQGNWTEIIKNYFEEAIVYEQGEYINDQRQGTWKYINKNKEIGGGSYDDQGFKHDQWVEISENFWSFNRVFYQGQYENGQKIGKWETYQKNQLIAGGQYNQNGLKVGKWVDLVENFWDLSEVTYIGEYNDGKKIGRWNIFFDGNQIGGGLYKDEELKNENWIEQCYNFTYEKQVTYEGEYKNGKKIGRWNINFRKEEDPFQQIGGGIYDKLGLKIGIWVEENDNFKNSAQIIYSGVYKKGKKLGKWNILYENIIIGGGYYNEQSMKIGKWIDLDDQFLDIKKVIYKGEYDNSKKVGKWDILYQKSSNNLFEEMQSVINTNSGGGMYTEESLKNGNWQDLSQYFCRERQVVVQKQYENGVEIASQKVMTRKNSNEQFQEI